MQSSEDNLDQRSKPSGFPGYPTQDSRWDKRSHHSIIVPQFAINRSARFVTALRKFYDCVIFFSMSEIISGLKNSHQETVSVFISRPANKMCKRISVLNERTAWLLQRSQRRRRRRRCRRCCLIGCCHRGIHFLSTEQWWRCPCRHGKGGVTPPPPPPLLLLCKRPRPPSGHQPPLLLCHSSSAESQRN